MLGASTTQRLAFKGKGGDLFVVLIVNMLLTFITLGLYYPWAKARKLSWYYEHTELDGHPFHFHGTGSEMFRGFIKAIALLLLIYGTYIVGVLTKEVTIVLVGILVMFVGLLAFIPLVIHGSLRYRSSRSSWRGIHFGYRGQLRELYRICLRDGLLTLITLGIYASWFTINVRRYTLSHMRYGSSSYAYKGDGTEYFLLNLKGYFLTLFTLGIYAFWWQSVTGSYRNAWRLERKRLDKAGQPVQSRANLMVRFTVIQLVYLLLVGWIWGPAMVPFAIAIAVVGFLLLESVNYIEHYGLRRQPLPSGRYEPVGPQHSWNSDHELGRIFLYELTRHSDHHYRASRKYQILRHFDESPQLPTGYPGAILTALVPPVWFAVMDQRVTPAPAGASAG